MGQERVNFRSTFLGGFAKSDVLEYIDQMEEGFRVKLQNMEKILASAQNARSEAESKLQAFQKANPQSGVKKLSADLEETRQQISRLTNDLQERETQLQGVETEKAELEKLIDTLTQKAALGPMDTAQLQELNQEIAVKDRLCSNLRTKNADLLRQLEDMKAKEGTDSENMKQEIAKLRERIQLMEAEEGTLEALQAKASKVEADAQKRAEKILADAQLAAQAEALMAKSETEDALKQMKQELMRVQHEFVERLAQASNALTSTSSDLDKLSGEVESMESDFFINKPVVLELLQGAGSTTPPPSPNRRVN